MWDVHRRHFFIAVKFACVWDIHVCDIHMCWTAWQISNKTLRLVLSSIKRSCHSISNCMEYRISSPTGILVRFTEPRFVDTEQLNQTTWQTRDEMRDADAGCFVHEISCIRISELSSRGSWSQDNISRGSWANSNYIHIYICLHIHIQTYMYVYIH